ncbi:hypothetical protein K2173_003778 [Erythroxylum novogranatense]|uniref:Transmembrane protein n=1 Tax=Erythroxylum novogranatense TaxID=1862640 RepID=A0AAV8SIX6_9ROSI|nr:hypothetical protein K2173_003778 [Erythroxylum novogranatense]
MANSTLLFLLFSVLVTLLSTPTATARPCKTLFIAYTFSIKPLYPNPNPNPNSLQDPSSSSSSSLGFVTQITRLRSFSSSSSNIVFNRPPVDQDDGADFEAPVHRRPVLPFGISSASIRDRTKDIVSVVVALLFGVGCGALTAATMYLLWSLYDYHCCSPYDSDDESDDDGDVKKIGYVLIPEVDSTPKPAKEEI